MHSALYFGWLDHRRRSPREHAFRYRLFMVYLDLAEAEEAFRGRLLWSADRPALACFARRDHFGDPSVPLEESVRALVASRTGRRPRGPIRVLTHLRYFGYVFNPVSFYYCFDPDGRNLDTVVAEVTNTPWGERHCYVLPQMQHGSRWLHARSEKAMHVSPFNPMALAYHWRFLAPGRNLAVHMTLCAQASDAGPGAPDCAASELPPARPHFGATLLLRRAPINGLTLAGALLAHPFMTAKVIAAIHWEALRLWIAGSPVHDHPGGRTAAASNAVSGTANHRTEHHP